MINLFDHFGASLLRVVFGYDAAQSVHVQRIFSERGSRLGETPMLEWFVFLLAELIVSSADKFELLDRNAHRFQHSFYDRFVIIGTKGE